jgi:hypothetical protein
MEFKLHKKLKRMTPLQRKALFEKICEEARARGMNVVEAPETPKPATKRPRRTG